MTKEELKFVTLHFTMLSRVRVGGLFVVGVMTEKVLSPGLVGGARSSSKLSLKTGALLQNNQNKATLNFVRPSLGSLNALVDSNLGSGFVV